MLKKEKICILIIIIMFLHGICFASVKSNFIAVQSGDKDIVICNPSVKVMLKEDMIFANEISSLSHTMDSIIKDVKNIFHMRVNENKKLSDLNNIRIELEYYLTSSIEIMSCNSSITQKAVIQYLYSKDGVKWNIA